MDWNRPNKLIRPNPDWEEDLFLTCVLDTSDVERIKSYPAIRKKKRKPEVCREICKARPGVALRITLNTGETIPILGLCTWLGVDKQGIPKPLVDYSTQAAVEMAIDAGYRLIDTAASYKNEYQVGRAIRNKIRERVVRRSDLFIFTKLWNDRHAEDDVVPALKESLARLRLKYVDLYLIHWPVAVNADGELENIDYLSTWRGMIQARGQCLTRAIGVANFNQHQLDRIISLTKMKPSVLRIEVTINLQQSSLLNFCRLNDIAVMAHSPFGSLFTEGDPVAPPPRAYSTPVLRPAMKYHKTSAQILLRYLLELGVIPVFRSTNPEHIHQNIQVFDFSLTSKEINVLKKYDTNHRTMVVPFWKSSNYYPF